MANNLTLSASHVFSYSQISAFSQCPHSFYLEYGLRMEAADNAYAQYGTLAHDLLDQYAKGEKQAFELAHAWAERHDKEVTAPYPPFPVGYRDKAFELGLSFFENFDGYGDEYDIVASEQRYFTDIGGCRFQGVVDLILRSKTTGRLSIRDHKSKTLASLKRDKTAVRQLYAYARFIKEQFGEFPADIGFHLFKEGGLVVKYDFDMAAYEETMRWLEDSIALISMETDWEPCYQGHFCQHICGVRAYCEKAIAAENGKG